MVHVSFGDLGVTIDYGRQQSGDILQRFENGEWLDYKPDGELIHWPFDIEALEPGRYRLIKLPE